MRTYSLKGCVPGRKSTAGIAVWLMMKNSARPQREADADAASDADLFIHRHDLGGEAIGIEAFDSAFVGFRAKPLPQARA